MKMCSVIVAAMICASRVARPQDAAQHVALGDRDVAARNLRSALQHYTAAVAVDSNNVEALWKAANTAIDLGEFSDADRPRLYAEGERLARLAVQANPNAASAHYALAKALGRAALTKGTMERVKYATTVHDEATDALRLDSLHAGALHVLGVWNAEIMRLNGFARFAARNLLGGKVMGEASWDNAQHDLERAVALEPNRVVHRLDLAAVYADRGEKDRARAAYRDVLRLPDAEYNDRYYKQIAERRLQELD